MFDIFFYKIYRQVGTYIKIVVFIPFYLFIIGYYYYY